MEIHLRRAEENDAHLLFQWRNDSTTTANSLNQKPVEWDEHEAWFKSSLKNPHRHIFIGMIGGDYDPIFPVGMIRFEGLIDGYEIGISIDPNLRCRGMGRSLLQAGIQARKNDTLFATIRGENVASLIIFLASGFQLVEYNQVTGLAYLKREPK